MERGWNRDWDWDWNQKMGIQLVLRSRQRESSFRLYKTKEEETDPGIDGKS